MTSLASSLRSSSGLRLIWMRPLFGVTLVPSTPMNDERLVDGGILEDRSRERLLPLGHGRERDRLRRLRDAEDHAGVLHREEALRDDDVEQRPSATSVATAHQQRRAPGGRAPSAACGRSASITRSKTRSEHA